MRPEQLEAARAKRWWLTKPKIATLQRAARFIDDVGFALLFARASSPMPSLWAVATDGDDWGPDAERAWRWKDTLPERGLAWYGVFLQGRKSFLAPDILRDLYPRAGEPDDFTQMTLSEDAARIARVVLVDGPTSAAVLREATRLEGKRASARFTKAIAELGRALVLTHHGVEEQGAGWPSARFELTARAFDLLPRPDPHEARLRAARRFLGTMVSATARDLARAYGWPLADARAALDSLVEQTAATRDGTTYSIA